MSAAIPSVELLYGPPAIGLIVASFMSGIVTMQAFMYYRNYPNDSTYVKVLVAFVWLLDLAHLVAIAHFVYYYTVTFWGYSQVTARLTWSWGVEILLNAMITGTCQLFLVFRVKVISGGNWWIVTLLAGLALTQLVTGIISGILGTQAQTDITRLARERPLGSAWLFSGAIGDTLLALSLAYYLRKQRTPWSRGLIDHLIIYVIGTGALTSIVAFADVATFIAMPETFVDIGFNFPLGRIYSNSLLSSLNSRQAIKNIGKSSTPLSVSLNSRPTFDGNGPVWQGRGSGKKAIASGGSIFDDSTEATINLEPRDPTGSSEYDSHKPTAPV